MAAAGLAVNTVYDAQEYWPEKLRKSCATPSLHRAMSAAPAPAQRIAWHRRACHLGHPLGRPWTSLCFSLDTYWLGIALSLSLFVSSNLSASMSGVRGAAKESQEGKLQGAAASAQQGELKGVAAEQKSEKQSSSQGQVRALTPRRAAPRASRCARGALRPHAQRRCRNRALSRAMLGRRRTARHAPLRARERRRYRLARRERCARLAFGTASRARLCILASQVLIRRFSRTAGRRLLHQQARPAAARRRGRCARQEDGAAGPEVSRAPLMMRHRRSGRGAGGTRGTWQRGAGAPAERKWT